MYISFMCVYIYIYIHMCMCMYVYVCIYIYMYIYREREREIDRYINMCICVSMPGFERPHDAPLRPEHLQAAQAADPPARPSAIPYYVIIHIIIIIIIVIIIKEPTRLTIPGREVWVTSFLSHKYRHTHIYTMYTCICVPMHTGTYSRTCTYASTSMDSLRGPSIRIGTMQRRLAWPLLKDDTQKSRSVNNLSAHEHMHLHLHLHVHGVLSPTGT